MFLRGRHEKRNVLVLAATKDTSRECAIASLLGRILDEELRAFGGPQNLVWTAGNNDGPHDAIFRAQDASTMAWADALLRRSIVSNDLHGLVYAGGRSQVSTQE